MELRKHALPQIESKKMIIYSTACITSYPVLHEVLDTCKADIYVSATFLII